VGAAIDLGGTFLVSIAAAVAYTVWLMGRGLATADIERAIQSLVPWSGFGLIPAFLGCMVSVLAGYQCAAIANRANYLAPGILSAFSTAAGAYTVGNRYSIWTLSLLSGITVAMTLCGAWLFRRRVAQDG
jgi:hypothetical protein